jgi:tetratricopeptide (TPR) repeat protein
VKTKQLSGAILAVLVAASIAGAQPPGQQPPAGQPAPTGQPGQQPPAGQPAPTGQPTPTPVPVQQPTPTPVPVQQPAPAGQPTPSPVPVQQPPGGPGLGPQPPPRTGPLDLQPAELAALKDVESEYERFIIAANQHDSRMRQIAKREFDTRTAELTTRYGDRIAKITADKLKRQGDTIALLEKFLKDHPSHEQFTPDKMFQLADLYLDRADEEVEAKLAAQEEAGSVPDADAGPILADYTPALDLWEGILKRFPSYRQTPSTLYLLAYYGKTKDERRSMQIFLALACANRFKWSDAPAPPPTRAEALKRIERKTLNDPYADCTAYPGAETELVRHAWIRGIADYHFTVPGELDEAIAAYLKVANGGAESRLYAESLYKLAWSYYKRDMLKDSIQRFDESVKLYDTIVAAGGTPQLELRDESIQYIAVAFTDPWEGETDSDAIKAFDRARTFYKGRENEPHVRDVWVAMGKAFADLQAWDQAIAAYRIAIGPPWELNPKNPVVHQEIVNVYEAKGDKLAADAAATELATRYAPGTAWYTANEKDREAMDNQRRIAERALYAATRNTHSAATTLRKDYEAATKKDPAAKQEYLAMYSKAVELYRTFIKTYPESDYVYEFNFLQGEALYWSERYAEAIEQYKWVRDHRDLGTAFYIDAARSVVQSYEAEAQRLVSEGKLAPLKVPTVAELKALPQPLQPQPIPAVYVQLQGEYDNYQNVVNDPAAAPQQGINAALISLAYLHADDAIARFAKVMEKFCGKPEAARAKDGILAIYEARSDFDAIEATNKKFIAAKCGDEKTLQLAIAQNRSLNFSRAAELYRNNQFVPAAESFYRFYKTAPQNDPDLPVALYNSAVSYKLADRPKTAIALFKEFTANPAKSFRESPYYLDAMRLQAASYQAAFDYNNAILTYLELYETAKKAKRLGIKAPDPLPGEQPRTLDQIRLDALFNAALASEMNRDFKKAIDLYTRYQAEETDVRKRDRALWSVAGIHRQSGDVNAMIQTYDKWRRTYGNAAENADDFVQTFYDEAALRRKKNQAALARKAGQDTIDAWKRRGAARGGRGAKLAGEWQLAQAEEHYTGTFEPLEIKTPAKTKQDIEAQQKQLSTAKLKAEDKYLALDAYGVAEYTMAAKVRFADIQYGYAQKIANAPIPTPIVKAGEANPDLIERFETTRDQNLKKFLDEAKRQWVEVVDLAKKGGISNRWSRLAQENLGREFPGEFTVLRQELVQGTDAP